MEVQWNQSQLEHSIFLILIKIFSIWEMLLSRKVNIEEENASTSMPDS